MEGENLENPWPRVPPHIRGFPRIPPNSLECPRIPHAKSSEFPANSPPVTSNCVASGASFYGFLQGSTASEAFVMVHLIRFGVSNVGPLRAQNPKRPRAGGNFNSYQQFEPV